VVGERALGAGSALGSVVVEQHGLFDAAHLVMSRAADEVSRPYSATILVATRVLISSR